MNRWSVTWRIRIVRRRPFFVFKQLFPHPKRFWRTSLFHIMALWYSTFASVSNNCQGSLKTQLRWIYLADQNSFTVRVSFTGAKYDPLVFVTEKAGILSDNFCVTRSRFVFSFSTQRSNHLFTLCSSKFSAWLGLNTDVKTVLHRRDYRWNWSGQFLDSIAIMFNPFVFCECNRSSFLTLISYALSEKCLRCLSTA